MAGRTKLLHPVDSHPELQVRDSGSASGLGMLPAQAAKMMVGEVCASSQGKGVGVFALGTSSGSENGFKMEEEVKDPKVCLFVCGDPDCVCLSVYCCDQGGRGRRPRETKRTEILTC